MNRPANNVVIAFAVHLFTASGAFWAFLALVAAAEQNFTTMWFWLGVALVVDGVDGPLARYFNVKSVLPNWSGELLDCIIDYVTFVLIPAFALYQSGFLAEIYSFICAALIVCTSAIYYADTRMKSRDNCFIGFPVCWNMLIFTLFVMSPSWYVAFGAVIVSAALTFAPIMFIHPVRVKLMRPLNLGVLALWGVFGCVALYAGYYGQDVPYFAIVGITITGLYLYCVGFVLQFLGKVA
ncbi:phosphatidylcholine/phosphatidylserine synthase [Ahrensia sp. R2A130]|uniref:CDP-alcohol phosphatidyltransferase family protein n=1 Tax=Ahrensia sp. R2A130 TaxID=744979 RepID=UPI0001E0D810|nr:phosphatidylcholine synthase [Ahrensia sp. R2A130]